MEPRPLLELHLQQAISSILQKHRWWVKAQDEEVRDHWLSEIEAELLYNTFEHTLMGSYHGQRPLDTLSGLLQEPNSYEKVEKLKKWLQEIVTEVGMDRDSDIEEDSDQENDEAGDPKDGGNENEENSDISPQEKQKLTTLRREVDAQESYSAVKWTINQLLLRERLESVPVEEWTEETTELAIESARKMDDEEVDHRAVKFVLVIRKGGNVKEALGLPEESILPDEERLLKLKLHCEKILRELDAAKNYIVKMLRVIAIREGLSLDMDFDKELVSPAGIDGVYISDNLISEDMAERFKAEVEVLENVPDDEKDWHPHSNKMVLDLVHPSLFCCVYGQTLRVPAALDPSSFATPAEQMHRVILTASDLVAKPEVCDSDYQWIPTDFAVGESGEPGTSGKCPVRILSYINNLHPEKYSALYDSIGNIFGRFVPMFERMLTDKAAGLPPSAFSVDMYSHDSWRVLPRRPRIPEVVEPPIKTEMVSLRGKTLQVIVKIAEIVLTPENPEYNGGVWHLEGTLAENIVGTGIYYFDSENVMESRLALRAEVADPMYQQNDEDGVAAVYGLFNDELLVQYMGSVETYDPRCIVFPNWLQHQVQPFELSDPSEAGTRKILVFFLIDPDKPIPSTSVIAPQQCDWIEAKLKVLTEMNLVDRVEQNIRSMLDNGMSLLEARQHRLQLMEERAALAEGEEDAFGYSRYFSLCEH